jgi:tRNA(His) 5'-end guanylyltransferase
VQTSLGIRIKENYEQAFKIKLPARMPVLLRVDGKSFSKYTKSLGQLNENFNCAMDNVALALCENIQGATVAYVQSDEVTVFIHNYKKLSSSSWFGNNIQKMVSVAASIAGTTMTLESTNLFGKIKPAYFDARVFVVPEAEFNNAFLDRQQDAIRNSIQMLARTLFSSKQLHRKGMLKQKQMILTKEPHDWEKLPISMQRGRCLYRILDSVNINNKPVTRSKWVVDKLIPVFSEDPVYLERFLDTEE